MACAAWWDTLGNWPVDKTHPGNIGLIPEVTALAGGEVRGTPGMPFESAARQTLAYPPCVGVAPAPSFGAAPAFFD